MHCHRRLSGVGAQFLAHMGAALLGVSLSANPLLSGGARLGITRQRGLVDHVSEMAIRQRSDNDAGED